MLPGDQTEIPIRDTYRQILNRFEDRGANCLEEIERFSFYDRVREKSYAVIMSGERATYL